MGMKNCLPSEVCAIVACIDPDANDQTTLTSDWVDMDDWDQVAAIVMVGVTATGATLDAEVQQATANDGTGAKTIGSGKSITQLTKAGSDDDKQAIINVRAEELDTANSFRYVALVMTPGDTANSPDSAAIDSAGVILGFGPRYLATDSDLATVDEIVN